jgi:hypothetical protein
MRVLRIRWGGSVSMVDITCFSFDPIKTGLLDYLVLLGTPYITRVRSLATNVCSIRSPLSGNFLSL